MSTTPTPPVCRGAGETAAEHFGEGAAATDSAMPAPEKDKHGKGEAGLAEAHASEEREEVAAAAGEQRRGGRSKRGAPTEDGGTPKIKNPQKKPRGGKRERADENAAVEIEMTPASKEGTVGAGAGDKASERQEIPEEKNAAEGHSVGPRGNDRRGTGDRSRSPGASASCAPRNSKRAKREDKPKSRGRSAAPEEATESKSDGREREGGGLTTNFAGLAVCTSATARSRRHHREHGRKGARKGRSRSRSWAREGSRTSSPSSSSAGSDSVEEGRSRSRRGGNNERRDKSDSNGSDTSRSVTSEGTALENMEDSDSESYSTDASSKWRARLRRRRRRHAPTKPRCGSCEEATTSRQGPRSGSESGGVPE